MQSPFLCKSDCLVNKFIVNAIISVFNALLRPCPNHKNVCGQFSSITHIINYYLCQLKGLLEKKKGLGILLETKLHPKCSKFCMQFYLLDKIRSILDEVYFQAKYIHPFSTEPFNSTARPSLR